MRVPVTTFSPTFAVVSVPYFGHSHKCVVVYHYCFNSQFSNDKWYGALFYMLICHPSILFGKVSLTHILIGLYDFLLWSFKSSFYSCDCSLSNLSFANIFSQSTDCFFILSTLSFTEQMFLILIKSSLKIISFMNSVQKGRHNIILQS